MVAGYKIYGYDESKHNKSSNKADNKNSTIPADITNVDFYDDKFMELIQK